MMMALPHPETLQDTVPARALQLRDSAGVRTDSSFHALSRLAADSVPLPPPRRKIIIPAVEITDTVSVCKRNIIDDVTFYDTANLVTRLYPHHTDRFPYLFTLAGRRIREEAKATLVKQLRPGDKLPDMPLNSDWIILVILFSAFMYTAIRKATGNVIQSLGRYFLFRGINDPSSRDAGGLFTWESTLRNFISFIILGLFAYSAAAWHNSIPASLAGMRFWLVAVLAIIATVTIRHLVCMLTGAISGEREVFAEYLISIYQFYRYSAIFLFAVTIFVSYTAILPLKALFISAAVILGILYLIRVLRLFIIFTNKNISLFYLILYLCALEILPFVISVKYMADPA